MWRPRLVVVEFRKYAWWVVYVSFISNASGAWQTVMTAATRSGHRDLRKPSCKSHTESRRRRRQSTYSPSSPLPAFVPPPPTHDRRARQLTPYRCPLPYARMYVSRLFRAYRTAIWRSLSRHVSPFFQLCTVPLPRPQPRGEATRRRAKMRRVEFTGVGVGGRENAHVSWTTSFHLRSFGPQRNKCEIDESK